MLPCFGVAPVESSSGYAILSLAGGEKSADLYNGSMHSGMAVCGDVKHTVMVLRLGGRDKSVRDQNQGKRILRQRAEEI